MRKLVASSSCQGYILFYNETDLTYTAATFLMKTPHYSDHACYYIELTGNISNAILQLHVYSLNIDSDKTSVQ